MRTYAKVLFQIATVFFLLCVAVISTSAADAGKYDKMAQCLTQKKATMYGTFWCSHCKDQKELFGSSFKFVTYVECAVPGTRQETEVCKNLGIKNTPTWIFSDGTRREGTIPLAELGQIAGCRVQ